MHRYLGISIQNAALIPMMAFGLLGVIWGSNFVYMKMASGLISPLQIVFFRVLFGFLPVFIYAWISGVLSLHHWRFFHHFVVMSLLATAVYYYGFAKGTSLLHSGIAGAVSGAIPLFSFILAQILLPEERAGARKIAGIIIGFVGVLILARPSGAAVAGSNLEGVFYMVLGSFSVGASFVYARKFITPLKLPAVALTTYQLGAALAVLALITDYEGISHIWTNPHASVGLVLGLGLLGTGAAYIIYYFIVERLGAVTASSVTYIPPLVALLIGALIVKEPIQILDYFATLMIVIGVFLLKRDAS